MNKRLLLGTVLALAGVCFVAAQEQGKSARPAAKAQSPKTEPTRPAGVKKAEQPQRSPEEQAVLAAAEVLVKAYDARDAKAFAASFTPAGEYVDEKGAVYHGRQAIEEDFAAFFKANPDSRIDLHLTAARPIAAGVVAADGLTQFTRAPGQAPVLGRCHLVCTKDSGKWLIASLHELDVPDAETARHDQVRQLEWLVGDWIDEGSDSHVHFNCRWDEGGNFLIRDFAVHVAGQKTITGTQRIGYDPMTGHLKTWIFDAAGGYADGYFHHEGNRWILHTSGVTADGRMAAGTNIFTPIDTHRMSWAAVDRVVGGEQLADVPKITIVRKPPSPTAKAK